MATIKINGIPGIDGEYPFEGGDFTNRELHTIKRISGVLAGELDEGFARGDNDLVVAIAVICLQRAGVQFDENALWDAPVGAIEANEEEEEQSPPAPTPLEKSGTDDSSGKPSQSAGGTTLEKDQSSTGPPLSAIGSG